MDASRKVTKRGRKRKNSRTIKAIRMSGAARSATLNMKIDKTGFFSKIDIDYFKLQFFPEKKQIAYSRLYPLSKVMCAQYVLHNHPDTITDKAQSYPFVFRLSPELNQLDHDYQIIKIRRKLSAVLNRSPLFWMITEYKTLQEIKGKHFNGEILLYPGELEKCEQLFKELFGLHNINPATNKSIRNADGTIKQKKCLRFAIRFPIASRYREIRNKGEFYAIYNWPSYASKWQSIRRDERRAGNSDKQGEGFYYITANLNKMASAFHAEHICGARKAKPIITPAKSLFGSW